MQPLTYRDRGESSASTHRPDISFLRLVGFFLLLLDPGSLVSSELVYLLSKVDLRLAVNWVDILWERLGLAVRHLFKKADERVLLDPVSTAACTNSQNLGFQMMPEAEHLTTFPLDCLVIENHPRMTCVWDINWIRGK